MSQQQPSIGRIVHYVLPAGSVYEGEHRPAILTQVWQPIEHEQAPGMCNLTVFKGQSIDFRSRNGGTASCGIISEESQPSVMLGSVLYSEEPKPGTWHWPERS